MAAAHPDPDERARTPSAGDLLGARADAFHISIDSLRPRRRGLSVAFLGPDGAGKSSLTAAIAARFPYPTRTVYLGLWQRPARRARPILPSLDLIGRLSFAWRRYLRGRVGVERGELVLFDRYTYDALLGLRPGQRLVERLYFWILGHACPPPDLVLLLDAPGRVAYLRKAEHDPERLEEIRAAYRELARQVPRIEIVDADRAFEEVLAEVTSRIAERWDRRP